MVNVMALKVLNFFLARFLFLHFERKKKKKSVTFFIKQKHYFHYMLSLINDLNSNMSHTKLNVTHENQIN